MRTLQFLGDTVEEIVEGYGYTPLVYAERRGEAIGLIHVLNFAGRMFCLLDDLQEDSARSIARLLLGFAAALHGVKALASRSLTVGGVKDGRGENRRPTL